jgi:hypothetical protein
VQELADEHANPIVTKHGSEIGGESDEHRIDDDRVRRVLEEMRDLQRQYLANSQDALRN